MADEDAVMEDSDDYELQLALALSVQEYDAGPASAGAQQPAAAAAAPAPAHAPAPTQPPPNMPDLAAALAAALQAVAGQGLGAAPAAAQPHHHQQQQQQQPQRRSAAAAPPAPPQALPQWAVQLGSWWTAEPADSPQRQLLDKGEVAVPLAEMPAALSALSAVLQQPLTCAAAEAAAAGSGAGQAGAAGALNLTCLCPRGASEARVRASDLDTLVLTWLPRATGAAPRGTGQLLLLASAYNRSTTSSTPAAAAAAPASLTTLLGLRLASKAVAMLAEDEEDLFFESGRAYRELLDALRSPSAGAVSAAFLSAMVDLTRSAEEAGVWRKLLTETLKGFAAYKLSGGVVDLSPHMLTLDRVTQEPRLLSMMAAMLAQEAVTLAAAQPRAPGADPLAGSLLAPLLAISSAANSRSVMDAARLGSLFSRQPGGGGSSSGQPGGVSPAAAAMSPATVIFTGTRSYPNNRGEVEGARAVLQGILARVADALHQVAKRLAGLKAPGAPPQAGREVLLGWLAAAALANECRCRGGEYGALKHLEGTPDGPMLTLVAAVLRLTKPFVGGYIDQNPKFADLFSRHLTPAYYATHGRRLGSATTEAVLSGDRGDASAAAGAARAAGAAGTAGGASKDSGVLAADPGAAAGSASFVAELFFIAQRFMHVGLLPAVHRFTKVYSQLYDLLLHQVELTGGDARSLTSLPPELHLFLDVTTSQLLAPDTTADATQFAALTIMWLADLLTKQKQQQQQAAAGGVFACIPESVLSDAAAWLTFVVQQRQAEQLASANIGELMRALTTVLEHPDQVRSLLVVSKIIHLLLAMLSPQVQVAARTQGALGPTHMSPGEAALVASVLGTPATQTSLVPALMRVYGAADFVVGLDVDKDDYDKFSMRHEIDLLLLELWQDTRCRGCMQALASAAAATTTAASAAQQQQAQLFPGFVSGLLNDLMYLFKDSLERLADIKQIEDSRRDTAAWSALTDEARRDKETFYGSQQRTTRGFMRYANTTLRLLLTLTGDGLTAAAFLVQPLLGRTAYAVLHFLELLVGPRCQLLDVEKPQQYNFDQQQLLATLVQMAGQLGQHAAFLQALAEEPDYDPALLASAVELLNKQHAYMNADTLQALAARVAAAAPARQAKKQRRSGDGSGAAAAGAAGADAEGAAAGQQQQQQLAAVPGGVASGAALDAQVDALVARWVAAVGASSAAGAPTTYDAAEPSYKAALEPLACGVFDASTPGAYNSQFSAMAAQPEGDASQKLKRLGRELRDLRGKTALPIAAAAAVFVRQDADRPDKVRCVITGPQDTPYEGGLFVFDVFFPPGYPNMPPLMVLETTGGGRARFNPNLYADGKVCLSLLGTWHGADAASKWNPASSSLFQILLSIQGMIFVEDPYFNEPNVELMRGTSEGNVTSLRYNAELRLATLRWAVLAQLRKPPAGLEDVVAAHFGSLRGVLAARAGRWLREAAAADASGTAFNRLVGVMDDIVAALPQQQQ